MAKFRYVGETERVYPDIIIPGKGSLVVNYGDEVELDKAPGILYWVELTAPQDSPASPLSLNINTATLAAPVNED